MSGSGGNAFLDLLRALAPAGLPVWVLILPTAILSVAAAAAMLLVADRFIGWVERRLGGADNRDGRRGLGSALAFGGTFGALAAYPLAPHVFFVDLELGLFVIVALLALATVAELATGDLASSPRTLRQAARVLADGIPIALALLVAVIIGGSANLIEASRLQSDGFGMGWNVFKNPFAMPALAILLLAAAARRPSGSVNDRTRLFLLSAIAAVFFLGGFESPLTFGLRRSLGLDPGFLNHVVLADGSKQTHVDYGGLLFQGACAVTLVVKTMLCITAILWLRKRRLNARLDAWTSVAHRTSTALGLLCVLGAGSWEWARAALWNSG